MKTIFYPILIPDDIVVKIMFKVGERMMNGNAYWVVESWKHTSEVQTGAHFLFRNLFHGNKALCKFTFTLLFTFDILIIHIALLLYAVREL